jgi:hypothetical protein
MTAHLPLRHCDATYCTNRAGFWPGQIVLVGRPPVLVAGWCDLCEKLVCSDCALRVELGDADRSRVPGLLEGRRSSVLTPWRLHCKRCGTLLKQDERKPLVLHEDAG